MIAGTKPKEYYLDQYGHHPLFALSSFVDADEIKDTMIDWGTGAGQVSAADVPIADVGTCFTGTEVETALQELAGSGRTTQTVKANADAIAAAVPPGVIWPYGGASAPAGFLLCDGTAYSEATYAALFAIIGHTYGGDPGGGNFYVPNLQGISPTGVGAQDIGGRTKTGPALGVVREDAMQGHRHNPLTGSSIIETGAGGQYTAASGSSQKISALTSGDPVTDGSNGDPRTGPYTHGPEIGMNYIIKT